MTNSLNTDILSPLGTAYCQVEQLKSVFSEYIEGNQKERKRVKKEMFLAEQRGNDQVVFMNDLRQKNIKLIINALSGVMLSGVTFRSSINYNAITATARFGIMITYAITEIALGSNYYFFSENKAINWIVSLLRIYPGDQVISSRISEYNLSIPTADKVFYEYEAQIKIYHQSSINDRLKQLIMSLSQCELTFVYYAMNLKRIFQENVFFKDVFSDMIDIENVTIVEGDIPNIMKLPDELILTLTTVLLSDSINERSLGDKKRSLGDIIDSDHEFAQTFYSIYIHIENTLRRLEHIFETFIMIPMIPSDIGLHKYMIRNTVLLSDTDSILFTVINWVRWFTGDIRITEQSIRFNGAIIVVISKFLEHVFAYMSASMNIGVENMRILNVKNEFMYDVFLRTAISKHYAGYVRYQEGIRHDPYKFDLKGKNFKGSDLCKETTSYVKWFIKDIFDNFLKTYELHPQELVSKAIVFEQRIKTSIENGETTFLMQKPINLKNQYEKPESSNYLYYELWQAVFAYKYGDLNLPQKTKELPISAVSVNIIQHLDHMKSMNDEMHSKFLKFLERYPKKKFLRVLIPMDMDIPEELRNLANYRKVCASNCYSLELILRSFNITCYPNKKNKVLFSDMYPTILKELTDDRRKEIEQAAANYQDEEEYYFEGDDEEHIEEDEYDDFFTC